MNDKKMVNEARQIIDGIRRHQMNADERLSNFDRQVDDLKVAMRKLEEAQTQEKHIVVDSNEQGLTGFFKDNGDIRLKTEKETIHLKNYGPVQTMSEGLLDSKKNYGTWHADLKKMVAERSFLKILCQHTPKTDAKVAKHIAKAPSFLKHSIIKSMQDTAGAGAGFVPDEFRDQLFEQFTLPKRLADFFETVEVAHNTLLLPRLNYGGRPFKRAWAASDVITDNQYRASTPQTAQATISIGGFATRYRIDGDLVEDSAIPLVSTLGKQIAMDLTAAYEDCMINGDSDGSHQDAIATWDPRGRWAGGTFSAGNDHREVFNGLRKQAFARSGEYSLSNAALTSDKLIAVISLMGEFASEGRVLITGPEMLISQFMSLSQVLTVDAFGPQATIKGGEIASIFGIPIVLSRFITADMATSGVYTGSGSTSGFVIANTNSYKHYQKQGISVEVDKQITSGAVDIVSSLRRTFDTPDTATAKNVAYGYNSADL
tara:strand:- start:1252 stop:2712 length:1461 start_codon:yes stop_codon:yes gene_type:complete